MSEMSDIPQAAKLSTQPAVQGQKQGLASLAVNAHGLLIALVLTHAAAYVFLLNTFADFSTENAGIFFLGMLASSAGFFIFTLFIRSFYLVARYQKPKSPTIAIVKHMWASLTSRQSALVGLPAIAILIPFMFLFVQIKNNITAVAPFSWDKTFYKLDKTLHFGTSPWEWLQPVLAHFPLATAIININYMLWFFIMWLVMVHFAYLSKNPVLRTRFFLAFFLTWAVGGNFLAIIFSSAGPAFYGHLNLGSDPYSPLMEILRNANQIFPVWAIDLQDQMWQANKGNGLDVGISAMPSIHNAVAMLFVLSLWSTQRKFALVLAVHAFFIYIGSFWLAWHYAVDAYLGWATAIFFWSVSAPIARWWHSLEPVRDFHARIDKLPENNA